MGGHKWEKVKKLYQKLIEEYPRYSRSRELVIPTKQIIYTRPAGAKVYLHTEDGKKLMGVTSSEGLRIFLQEKGEKSILTIDTGRL